MNKSILKSKNKKKNLISLADVSKSELKEMISLTGKLKIYPLSKAKFLYNKSVALIFAKPSLRTRVSFEVGIRHLGGSPITIKMDEISVGKRENVEDIANVFSRYVSAIVIRTFEQKQIKDLGMFSQVPVINGLSNDEHPCQVISDLFTIKETFKNLDGLKLTYVGDGNNVANSLLIGCALCNINISIASPKGYEVNNYYLNIARKLNNNIKIQVTEDPYKAVKDSDILYTDVWTSMGQEKEEKKREKIFKPYQINEKLLSNAKKHAIVLHCLPAHKGKEISSDTFDKFSHTIYRQAENRLHAQKAILIKLIQ